MAFKDYYKILGVDKNATPDAIKKAYRKLAVQYHPDKTKNDKRAEEKFKEVNEAHDVLSDPEKRKRYDEFGENWEHFQHSGEAGPTGRSRKQQTGNRGGSFTFDATDFENDERMEDLLRHFFGGQFGGARQGGRASGGRPYGAIDGNDLEAEIQITLEEAFAGSARMIDLGTEKHRLTLKRGVRDGQQFRLRGKGQPGRNGGKNGDLLVHIRIAPHPRYTREGINLHCRHHVDLITAVLGGKTRVHTLHGDKMATLQPGTQNGASLRMRGLGMPDYDHPDTSGDLYLDIQVDIPRQLSPEERDLFNKLADLKHHHRHAENL